MLIMMNVLNYKCFIVLQLSELDKAMNTGSRLKGIAKVLMQVEKAKKMHEGKVTSQACNLQ